MSVHRFRSMGCDVEVGGDAGGGVAAAERLFHEYDRRFTRFRGDSELARVNQADGPVLVSAEFARAVRAALRAFRLTDGLVDPTLLDALEAAGYDRDFAALRSRADRAPDARADRAPAATLAPRASTARSIRILGQLLVRDPGVRLDLNGVVKSLAVDHALALVGDGWVSAGGDVAASRPLEVALPGGGQIRLESGALATSGTATRQWVRDGVEQHHLIDPRTLAPSDSPWEQVTACGSACVDADIAAKAAFLLGDDGPGWLDARGIAGRFVRQGGRIHLNGAWRACT